MEKIFALIDKRAWEVMEDFLTNDVHGSEKYCKVTGFR